MLPVYLILFGVGTVFQKSLAVPPDACFARFRNEDCGLPPKAVMYYYKPGSRCEVGLWRGCLPNLNMFADEYECVRTCIFVERARDEDYHNQNKADEKEELEEVTEPSNGTDTTDTDGTTIADGGAGNGTDAGDAGDAGGEGDGEGGNEVTTEAAES